MTVVLADIKSFIGDIILVFLPRTCLKTLARLAKLGGGTTSVSWSFRISAAKTHDASWKIVAPRPHGAKPSPVPTRSSGWLPI